MKKTSFKMHYFAKNIFFYHILKHYRAVLFVDFTEKICKNKNNYLTLWHNFDYVADIMTMSA